jgi:plasmid stabilization system protein ParE
MYPSYFTELAESDVTSSIEYISYTLNAPEAAKNLYYEIYRKRDLIEENPFLFPLVRDPYLSKKGIRWTGVKNYMMFYKVNESEKKIIIIRFLYGRSDWSNILMEGI